MFRAGEDLIERFPEAGRAIAGVNFRRGRPSMPLDEQLAPALRAPPHTGMKADKFLLSLAKDCLQAWRRSAPTWIRRCFHPGLQVDAVRPEIH